MERVGVGVAGAATDRKTAYLALTRLALGKKRFVTENIRGSQRRFSRVVFEVVLGTGFHFVCIGNQSLVFALDFTLVFGTVGRHT